MKIVGARPAEQQPQPQQQGQGQPRIVGMRRAANNPFDQQFLSQAAQVPAELMKGFGQGVGNTMQSLGGTATMLSQMPVYKLNPLYSFGNKYMGKALEGVGGKIAEAEMLQRPEDMRDKSLFKDTGELLSDPRYYARLTSENLPNLLTMLIPGMGAQRLGRAAGMGVNGIKWLGRIGAFTGGGAIEAGAAYNEAKREMTDMRKAGKVSYTDDEINKLATREGLIVGAVNGMLEALPFDEITKATPEIKRGLARIGAKVYKAGLALSEEAATEFVQEWVPWVVGQLRGKETPAIEQLEQATEAALAGGLLGGGASMVAGGGAPQQQTPPVAPPTDALVGGVESPTIVEQGTPTDALAQPVPPQPEQSPPTPHPDLAAPQAQSQAQLEGITPPTEASQTLAAIPREIPEGTKPTEVVKAKPTEPSKPIYKMKREELNAELRRLNPESNPEEMAKRIDVIKEIYKTRRSLPPEGVAGEQVLADMSEKARVGTPRKSDITQEILRWKQGEPIEITPDKLLRYSLQHEVKGARQGYRAGQLNANATDRELLAYAKENLPNDDFKLVSKALEKALKARTPREIEKVREAVATMAKKQEVASAVSEFKDVLKSVKKIRMPSAVKSKIDRLAGTFALKESRDSTIADAMSTLDAVNKDELGEIPYYVVEKARGVLAGKDKTLIRNADPDDIRAVTAAITAVANGYKRKSELFASRKAKDAKQAKQESISALKERRTKQRDVSPSKRFERSKAEGLIKTVVRWLTHGNVKTETFLFHLFGMDAPAYEITYTNLVNADKQYAGYLFQAEDYLRQVYDQLGITSEMRAEWSDYLGDKNVSTVTVDLPGATDTNGKPVASMDFTVGEMMGLYALSLDPSRRAELIRNKGGGIVYDTVDAKNPVRLTAESLASIEANLSEQQKAVAQAMFQYLNTTQKSIINAESMRVLGIEMAPLDNRFPSKRNRTFADIEPNAAIRESSIYHALESAGMFKERSKQASTPLIAQDVFKAFYEDVDTSSAFAAKAAPVHDAKRLWWDKEFTDAVRERSLWGDETVRFMQDTVLAYEGLEHNKLTPFERVVKTLRRRAHRGILGLKPHIVLYQPISYLNAATALPIKYLRQAVLMNRKVAMAEMKAYNPIGRARVEGSGHNIATPGTGQAGIKSFHSMDSTSFSEMLDTLALGPIHKADTFTVLSIWNACKLEGIDKGLSGEALTEYVADRWNDVVTRTQPAWSTVAMNAIQRQGNRSPLIGLITMFSSQTTQNFNMALRGVSEFMHSDKTAGDTAQMIKNVGIPTIVSSTMVYVIGTGTQALLKAALGMAFDEKEAEKEEFELRKHIAGVFERLFGNWLVGGDILSEIIDLTILGGDKNPAYRRDRKTAIARAFSDAKDAIYYYATALSNIGGEDYKSGKHKGTSKSYIAFLRAVEETLNASVVLFGVPVQGGMQITRPYLPQNRGTAKKSAGIDWRRRPRRPQRPTPPRRPSSSRR